MRLPVALKMALTSAGAIAGVPGSPAPPIALSTIDDGRFYLRRFVHAQHRIVVEIALRHRAATDRNVAVQRRGQSINNAAFHLRPHAIRVHSKTCIDCAKRASRNGATGTDLDFDDLRHDGPKRLVDRDAPAEILRQFRVPVREFRRRVQHLLETRRVVQEVVSITPRILSGREGELIDKRLREKCMQGMIDAAPESPGYVGRRLGIVNVLVVDAIRECTAPLSGHAFRHTG